MRIIADGKHFFCGEDVKKIRKNDLLPVVLEDAVIFGKWDITKTFNQLIPW